MKNICAFHTTLTNSKKCQNKGVLATIKPFMCIPRTSQPTNLIKNISM
jgi:hypothetical protein